MNTHVEAFRAHVAQSAALAFVRKDYVEQIKAGKRQHVAFAARAWVSIVSTDEMCATAPRVKREALGERACGTMRKIGTKKNRAERLAARNLKG